MCLVLSELGPDQKLEETQTSSLKCLRQPAQILLDSAVLVVRPADINKRRVQQLARFQARSKDQEILEEGGGTGPSNLPRRDHELGWASWTSFASSCPSCSSTAVQRTLSLWFCPSTAVETAIAQCTSRWAMARGHRLNTSIVLAAVRGLSGLFRAVSAVEPSLCRPLPTLSPSLIGHLASVDVKQHERRW